MVVGSSTETRRSSKKIASQTSVHAFFHERQNGFDVFSVQLVHGVVSGVHERVGVAADEGQGRFFAVEDHVVQFVVGAVNDLGLVTGQQVLQLGLHDCAVTTRLGELSFLNQPRVVFETDHCTGFQFFTSFHCEYPKFGWDLQKSRSRIISNFHKTVPAPSQDRPARPVPDTTFRRVRQLRPVLQQLFSSGSAMSPSVFQACQSATNAALAAGDKAVGVAAPGRHRACPGGCLRPGGRCATATGARPIARGRTSLHRAPR